MWRQARTVGIAAALVVGSLMSAACSSGDEEDGSATTTGDSSATTGDAAGTDAGDAGPSMACDELLTQAEVEGLFGEPAMLEDTDALSNNADLGQTTCTWTTVEDENDTEDLASQLLVLQLYDGTNVSGADFYEPEVQYPDAQPLDIGDEGFVDVSGGVDVGFLDGDTSGFLSWSAIDLSGDAPDAAANEETVVALARAFHERVS